jgi:hypothetical protein
MMTIPLQDGAQLKCLEDWDNYSRLNDRRVFLTKYWYLSVAVPIVVGIGILVRFFNDASWTVQNIMLGVLFAWVFFVIMYSLTIALRFLFIRCPSCGWRFGPGDFCGSCGLPRSRSKLSPADDR